MKYGMNSIDIYFKTLIMLEHRKKFKTFKYVYIIRTFLYIISLLPSISNVLNGVNRYSFISIS